MTRQGAWDPQQAPQFCFPFRRKVSLLTWISPRKLHRKTIYVKHILITSIWIKSLLQ
jgi:hypothetical protein